MVVLPICSVEYLRNFAITKYGSTTNPFGSMFEEFCYYKIWQSYQSIRWYIRGMLSKRNMAVLPIYSAVYLRNFAIAKYGCPTNPLGSMFVELCHSKIC